MKRNGFVIAPLGIAAVVLLTPTGAHAYLDAGTGSMLIQAAIAAIAGCIVTARAYWDRIKAWLQRRSAEPAREGSDGVERGAS